ncbi:MAG: hypothetical protein NXH91_14780 [Phyllobacteriaceae bacterium]|nr:hypothetical protein [Phyllobacteriaceae bacterium]
MAKAASRDEQEPPAAKSPPKQAVIVIHGMGQQRPMQTLRSIVRVLWETDLGLTDGIERREPGRSRRISDPQPGEIGPPDPVNKSWLVPDTRTGSKELARVTTPVADNGMRTDFYELYWADIMEGTTREHLVAWVKGLLWRWPHQVPVDVMFAWALLWVATIAGIMFAINGVVSLFAEETAGRIVPAVFDPYWPWLVLGLAGLVALFYARRLAKRSGDVPVTTLDYLFALALPFVIAAIVLWYLPVEIVASASFLSFAATAVIGWFIQGFLVPYFGDVARYVRAEPSTVAKRAAVMERGLDLLRTLHGKVPEDDEGDPPSAPEDKGKTPEPKYDLDAAARGDYKRIVIVAHSLGSVIAYDLLRHFWAERGPVAGGVIDDDGRAALMAMSDYVDAHAPDGKALATFDIGTFRTLQRRVSKALGQPKGGWLVTDFVTLGSPLTHGEFLLARDRSEFEQLKQDGLVPVCPPLPDPVDQSILYAPKQDDDAPVARHTALFSAVRWTNIHDRHWLVFFGDIVSGSLTDLFGAGIADHHVALSRRPFGFVGRIFTHLDYWSDTIRSRVLATNLPHGGPASSQPHIDLLREGVALDAPIPGVGDAEQQS